jgi:hypothetical protein
MVLDLGPIASKLIHSKKNHNKVKHPASNEPTHVYFGKQTNAGGKYVRTAMFKSKFVEIRAKIYLTF